MDRGAWRLTFNRAAKSQTQPSDLTTCVCVRTCMHAQSFQSCPTLRDPKGHTPQGSSVHEIFLARIQKWVAKPFSRGPSWPRDQTCVCCVSCIAGGLLSLSHQGSPCVCVCVCVCVYTTLNYPWWNHNSSSRSIKPVHTRKMSVQEEVVRVTFINISLSFQK